MEEWRIMDQKQYDDFIELQNKYQDAKSELDRHFRPIVNKVIWEYDHRYSNGKYHAGTCEDLFYESKEVKYCYYQYGEPQSDSELVFNLLSKNWLQRLQERCNTVAGLIKERCKVDNNKLIKELEDKLSKLKNE